MSREHPWKCPHGTMLGGHESFGYADAMCLRCDIAHHTAPVKMGVFIAYGLLTFNLGIAFGAWLFG